MNDGVYVVRTGTANMASVIASLERAGVTAHVTQEPSHVLHAARLILPGVGTFGATLSELKNHQLIEPLRNRILQGYSTFATCVGMQSLCAASEESPEISGIGIIPFAVTRFSGNIKIPQFGWNHMHAESSCHLLQDAYVYFANSYCLRAPVELLHKDGWSMAYADHGGRFIAALERGNILACQFHAELSGTFGQQLLERWLAMPARCES